MIALLLSAAAALAQESLFTGQGMDCGEYDVIMGTAGLRNAGEAVQTNANTYSASAFAGRHFARIHRTGGTWAKLVTDYNATFGAARLPTYNSLATVPRDGDGNYCDPKYQVGSRPFDLHATNFGFAVGGEHLAFIYATSLTYAMPAYGDQLHRFFLGEFVALPYLVVGSALTPVVDLLAPGPTIDGLDYLIGTTVSVGTLDGAAAYLGSRGGYFQVSETLSGAYAFGSFPLGRKPILQGGFDRLAIPGLEKAGLTTAEYQQIPFVQETDEPLEDDRGGSDESFLYQLRVGNLQQQNIARVFDFGARYRITPSPEISELALGIHTPDFHQSRETEDVVEGEGFGGLLRTGFVTTPTAWAEGNGPGRLLSVRAEAGGWAEGGTLRAVVLYNDPAQLQLYPFARNAVSYQLLFRGAM